MEIEGIMAKKTAAQAAEFLRELTTKVKNGVVSSAEAERQAILALQEVEETTPEEPVVEEDTQVDAPAETPPSSSAVDPKTKILSSLTKFEEAIESSLRKFEKEITDLLKGTAGAAVPLGDFSIGGGRHGGREESSAKLTVEQGDKPATAVINYLLKRNWTITDIQMPVTGSVKPKACNLPLRQDMLALCADVRENTSSEMAWKKGKKLPLEQVQNIESIAQETGDYRVKEILDNRPTDALADSWKRWAIAGQVYLLGSDFSEIRSFTMIKNGL